MLDATKKTVLVVDDDQDIRDAIRDILARESRYRVLMAADGQEALELLQRMSDVDSLCVVLADVHMPRLDGPGLARAIRKDAKLSHVKILVVSSAPEYAAGLADEAMSKPFDLEQLLAAVRRLCFPNC
jgi:two-component system chemotaxis sensor kinase CheA